MIKLGGRSSWEKRWVSHGLRTKELEDVALGNGREIFALGLQVRCVGAKGKLTFGSSQAPNSWDDL